MRDDALVAEQGVWVHFGDHQRDRGHHPAGALARPPADGSAGPRRIRRRDVLVHHPYDAFDTTVGAFLAAARDPKVAALKATVYRTGDPSATLQ